MAAGLDMGQQAPRRRCTRSLSSAATGAPELSAGGRGPLVGRTIQIRCCQRQAEALPAPPPLPTSAPLALPAGRLQVVAGLGLVVTLYDILSIGDGYVYHSDGGAHYK